MTRSQHVQEPETEQEHEYTNRLVDETSPYLLQHAHNPVDWHPWGAEAIAAARDQNKPIFLSVGYATCYWCHVMERESFENPEIAAVMNEHFICVKVDREERPDIDDIYMTAVQAMTGSGGWPMNVCLEPQTLKPFFGGTYFPPENRHGRRAFPDILKDLARAWQERPDDILTAANRVAEFVAGQMTAPAAPTELSQMQLDQAVATLMRIYDPRHGGFGQAPKFPQPVFLDLLMAAGWEQTRVQDAVRHTLDAMATGGMYDQIGGGFHRYSTDAIWLVPHFEKMLYDNGQLATVYSVAYERTGNAYYAEVARGIADYVLREMRGDHGAFYSAQDAEVDAREGLNYLWLEGQMRETLIAAGLSEDDADFAVQVYGLERGTNFTDPHHPEDGAKNVVFLTATPEKLAGHWQLSFDEFAARRQRINAALLAARDQRKQPITDDKVLAGWNGLMIAGLADCGRILNEPSYTAAAAQAAEFVLTSMRSADGGLLRTYRADQSKIDAFLSDYAMMIRGLLALHAASADARWLEQAKSLATAARDRFWDSRQGGYFDTLADQPDLFVRGKSSYDGAVPSGNGTMALILVRLYELTNDVNYLNDAKATLNSLSQAIAENPVSTSCSTIALSQLMAIDPDWQASTPSAAVAQSDPDQTVTVSVDRTDISFAASSEQTIQVSLKVAAAYHINSNDPGRDDLIPLQVELVDADGIEASVLFPAGSRYREELSIYNETVVVPVTLRKTGTEVSARGKLRVTYQACRDEACLLPRTQEFDLEFQQ